jgi:preprotein translocase SecE subunit
MAKLSAYLPKFMFVREAYHEMKHVTWPTPRKVGAFTILVVVFSVVFSYVVSMLDAGFLAGLKGLHSEFGNPIAAPQFNTNLGDGAQILDANGNEIDVTKLLDENDLKNIKLKSEAASADEAAQ